MGNHRFRLSDMMPNSWFYKLKDMGRPNRGQATKRILHHHSTSGAIKVATSSSSSTQQLYLPNRPSYYFPSRDQLSTSPAHPKAFDTHFPADSPKKSKKKPRKKGNTVPISSVPSSSDIIIDVVESEKAGKGFDYMLQECRLPRIVTKPAKKEAAAARGAELDGKHIMLRRAQGLHRIKVRPSSPRIEIKKVQQASKSRRVASSKRLAESFVVVKRSADPRRDFKESMVEMIVENGLRSAKALEELLACYLALNSDEYHGMIVKVFEEIWSELMRLESE